MARGWESKSIESQQAEAERERNAARGEQITAGERAIIERRRGLELARAKAETDRRAATHPAHKQMLERTLAAIDAELRALDEVR